MVDLVCDHLNNTDQNKWRKPTTSSSCVKTTRAADPATCLSSGKASFRDLGKTTCGSLSVAEKNNDQEPVGLSEMTAGGLNQKRGGKEIAKLRTDNVDAILEHFVDGGSTPPGSTTFNLGLDSVGRLNGKYGVQLPAGPPIYDYKQFGSMM